MKTRTAQLTTTKITVTVVMATTKELSSEQRELLETRFKCTRGGSGETISYHSLYPSVAIIRGAVKEDELYKILRTDKFLHYLIEPGGEVPFSHAFS